MESKCECWARRKGSQGPASADLLRRHDEKTAKEFGVEGGSVLHVSGTEKHSSSLPSSDIVFVPNVRQLVLALRGGAFVGAMRG